MENTKFEYMVFEYIEKIRVMCVVTRTQFCSTNISSIYRCLISDWKCTTQGVTNL